MNSAHFQEANEDAINFILVMDALNFCFWPDDPEKQFTVRFPYTAS